MLDEKWYGWADDILNLEEYESRLWRHGLETLPDGSPRCALEQADALKTELGGAYEAAFKTLVKDGSFAERKRRYEGLAGKYHAACVSLHKAVREICSGYADKEPADHGGGGSLSPELNDPPGEKLRRQAEQADVLREAVGKAYKEIVKAYVDVLKQPYFEPAQNLKKKLLRYRKLRADYYAACEALHKTAGEIYSPAGGKGLDQKAAARKKPKLERGGPKL